MLATRSNAVSVQVLSDVMFTTAVAEQPGSNFTDNPVFNPIQSITQQQETLQKRVTELRLAANDVQLAIGGTDRASGESPRSGPQYWRAPHPSGRALYPLASSRSRGRNGTPRRFLDSG